MIKDNSVNPLCLEHSYVEIAVLGESVVDFVPVRTNLSCVCSSFILERHMCLLHKAGCPHVQLYVMFLV